MNWQVFWMILVVVPVTCAALVGCVYGLIELEFKYGWRWLFPAFLGLVILSLAILVGLTKP